MAERLSIYLDAGTMMKLHDLHKLIGRDIPCGVSTSKAIAYCVIAAWQREFGELGNPNNWSDEERAVVAKYAPTAPDDGKEGR